MNEVKRQRKNGKDIRCCGKTKNASAITSNAKETVILLSPKSDCESAISMNCKCRRMPFIFLMLSLTLFVLMGNISLSVHVSGGILHSVDLNTNHLTNEATVTGSIFPVTTDGATTGLASPSASLFNAATNAELRSAQYLKRKLFASFGLLTKATPTVDDTESMIVQGADSVASSRGRIRTRQAVYSNLQDQITRTLEEAQQQRQELLQPPQRISRRKRAKKLTEPFAASMAPNATFSACLLIKDDNDILSEWIAYHYHVVRMRYLIVAVDPLSSETPEEVLKLWSNYTDLQIDIWDDSDFMPNDFIQKQRPPNKYLLTASDLTNIADSTNENLQSEKVMLVISSHRYRQRIFLNTCMKYVRDVKRLSWVMHIDTDEYVVPSKLLRQMNPAYVNIQDMSVPGSVVDLLQQVVSKTGGLVNYPCVSMLRVLFGSLESSLQEIMEHIPSDMFDPTKFETLRWRYHALPNNRSLHGNPKVILDVAAIPSRYFDQPQEPVFSIHRPVQDYCPKNTDMAFHNFRKQPLAVNHYLGSWERYSGRNDKRRSRSVYESKADVARRGKDDAARMWLSGFVETVGIDTAQILLRQYLWDSGTVPHNNNNNTNVVVDMENVDKLLHDEEDEEDEEDGTFLRIDSSATKHDEVTTRKFNHVVSSDYKGVKGDEHVYPVSEGDWDTNDENENDGAAENDDDENIDEN